MNHTVNEILSSLVDQMQVAVLMYRADESREILYANNKALEIFECASLEELIELAGGDYPGLVLEEDRQMLERVVRLELSNRTDGEERVNYRIHTKGNRYRSIETFGRQVNEVAGEKLITLKFYAADSRYMTYASDRVTGLPGFREFLDRMEAQTGEPFSLLYFDVHHFKSYNINHGLEKGDNVLRQIASILMENFDVSGIARISDDHFTVFTKAEDIDGRLENVHDTFATEFAKDSMELKVGIFQSDGRQLSLSAACDFARMACSAVKHSIEEYYKYFDEKLREKHEISEYVVHDLDRAIENHDIKVYYQPVVRTINRFLCGFEALARWDDPEKGLLSPAYFITALEDSKLIYKLDLYIVNEVCRQMRMLFDCGKKAVPVSFNLSRIDFTTCDVFSEVEAALKKYEIPRDMIRIEVTESMMVKNDTIIKNTLERFQGVGYQVWMDDFGSGYSSLNLLKDYHFDEIKIDMAFLSSFTDRSKSILTAIVDMAKRIGIQTLAEGVETEEQFIFLQRIGCEKVQGYYFGKPMPLMEILNHCEKQGLKLESRGWQKYFDEISKVDLTTDRTLAIYEYTGERFNLLHMNRQFGAVLQEIGTEDITLVDANINEKTSPLTAQFLSLHYSIQDDDTKTMDFSVRGQTLRISAKRISSCGENMAYQVEISNLTKKEQQSEQQDRDHLFRMTYLMYDALYRVDLEKNQIFHIMNHGFFEIDELVDIDGMGVAAALQISKRELIYELDHRQYEEWIRLDTLKERIRKSGRGFISELFRTKEPNGSYVWKAHQILTLPGTDEKQFLFAISDTPLNNKRTIQRFARTIGIADESDMQRSAELWNTLVDSRMAHIFWKDRNRRFVGANRNFLDFYGMEDVTELIGKTDEDLRWHVSPEKFRQDEINVLTKGYTITNQRGKCIVKGREHTILVTKAPIFENGEIIGLLGYFVDLEDYLKESKSIEDLIQTDEVTGLLNTRGMMVVLSDYVGEWKNYRKEFALVRLTILAFQRILETYGESVADCLLKQVAEIITRHAGKNASCARIFGADFNLLIRYDDQEELEEMLSDMIKEVTDIHQVMEKVLTVYVDTKVIRSEQVTDMTEMIGLIMKVEQEG